MNLWRNQSGQVTHPVILGIVTIGVVAVLFGVMVMINAEIETSVMDSADLRICHEDWNSSVAGTWVGVTYGMTPYPEVNVFNATTTFTEGSDFEVRTSDSTIRTINGTTMLVNASFQIDYNSVTPGYESAAKIEANIYKGFNLGSIAPIVMAAALVITIVLGLVGAMYVGRREE